MNEAVAQQQIFTNYTVNDGLVANRVRRVFQDAKGFLWIGTLEGISQYDGHRFTNYNNSNGLQGDMVNDFYESNTGALYIALNNGNIARIKEGTVSTSVHTPDVVVNRFLAGNNGQLLAATDAKGIQLFQNERLSLVSQALPHCTATSMIWLDDSTLLTVSDWALTAFDEAGNLVAALEDKSLINIETAIYQDSKKRVWVGSLQGLRLLSGLPVKAGAMQLENPPPAFRIPPLQQYKINNILEDANGTFWFATDRCLVKVDPSGRHRIFSTRDGLSSNLVNHIFQDREKNLWFGTSSGLSKLSQQGIHFYPVAGGFFESNYSYLLYPLRPKKILVGTMGGLKLFDKSNGTFSAVGNSKGQNFHSAISTKNTLLLFGANRVSRFNSAASQVEPTAAPKPRGDLKVVGDRQGNFFIAEKGELFFVSGNQRLPVLHYRISALLIDKNGDLWAGTWANGLFRLKYRFANNELAILKQDHLLPNENIRSLFEDAKGVIWAGTRYSGVFRLAGASTDGLSISNYNQAKGLASNFIKGIREDGQGNYWIAFYQGLDKLVAQGDSFRVFSFSRVNNFSETIIGIETDGEYVLWIATPEGLVHIEKDGLENAAPLLVYITKIVSGATTFTPADTIELSHLQNHLGFEFSAPGFINEKQVLYSYRLTGNSAEEWTKPANQHAVSYASLTPGDYLFEVRSLGWNGEWGKITALPFSIQPPFWQTAWFIGLLAAIIIGATYGFIKWRERNIRTLAAQKMALQQLNAGQLKNKLEMDLIVNYFSSSLIGKNTEDAVMWDVARNLIGRLGFVDCMIYLWNDDKTKMIQKAGFGPKGSIEEISSQPFDVVPGQGVVGYVMQTVEPVLIPDTSVDARYRADEMVRLSEMTVPVIHNNRLVGIIDCEHHEKNFFTTQHLQLLTTIATLMANKINAIKAEASLQQTQVEMHGINEQLSQARLEALQSQMNPHFIFNCINSIDALIHSNDKYGATVYLNKFAKLLRNILDGSRQNTVTLSKDVDTLRLYIELEEMRNEGKFTTELNVSAELLESDYKIPPLIIQPFVENAILHGLKNKESGTGLLQISIQKNNGWLQYIVTDNGIGREAASSLAQNKEGHYGVQISCDRIKLFNGEENTSVWITDLFAAQKPAGTEVRVHLKLS